MVKFVMKMVVMMMVREVVNTCILVGMMVLKLMRMMMMKQVVMREAKRVVVGKVEQ